MDDTFDLSIDAQGRLILRRLGHDDLTDVRIRRAFPWSSPDRHVSIRSSEGKEILLIDDVATLPVPVKSIIQSTLAATSFIPRITRIDHVNVSFGYQQWHVQTDRGPAEFRVQEREDIRFMPDGRFSVKDADGNIYELASLAALDEHSRKALEPLV